MDFIPDSVKSLRVLAIAVIIIATLAGFVSSEKGEKIWHLGIKIIHEGAQKITDRIMVPLRTMKDPS